MTDFNQPTNSSLYTDVLTTLNAKITSVAKMDFTGDTNVPTGAWRLTSSTGLLETWSGSAWTIQGYVLKSSATGTAQFAGNLKAKGDSSDSANSALTVYGGASDLKNVSVYPSLTSGSYNPMVQSGDTGIIFHAGSINTGNLLIAPWSSASVGIRITSAGGILIATNYLDCGDSGKISTLAVNGNATGTGGGASLVVKNGGSDIMAIGNDSTLNGGAYSAQPCIRFWGVPKVRNLTANAGSHFMKWSTTTAEWTYDVSSARYKENIRDCTYGLEAVENLTPRQFRYKDGGKEDIGFIAEEMLDVIPEVVAFDSENRPDAISYDRLTAVLCKAIQELAARLEALEAQIAPPQG